MFISKLLCKLISKILYSMCGIIGFSKKKNSDEINSKFIKYGINLLKNRGPDDFGDYYNNGKTIGLGQTRLSILDLSQLGHQPMFSSDGRYVIVYNGEIYNFQELRSYLSKYFNFKSNTDSEVVLYSYIYYGNCFLEKLNGIFSLAIYDKKEDQLIIARDRFGTKPLYYAKTPSGFCATACPLITNWPFFIFTLSPGIPIKRLI